MAKKQTVIPAAFTGIAPNDGTAAPLPKLRDITDMEQKLTTLLEAGEGELTPEAEAIMAELEQDRAAFFERWGLHLLNEKGKVEYLLGAGAPFALEYERLKAKAQAIANEAERSRARLMHEMAKRDMRRIDGKEITLVISQNPPKVDGAEQVPVEVLEKLYASPETRELVAYTPEAFALDKAAVKAAITGGILPEELIAHNVGLVRGEKLEIK